MFIQSVDHNDLNSNTNQPCAFQSCDRAKALAVETGPSQGSLIETEEARLPEAANNRTALQPDLAANVEMADVGEFVPNSFNPNRMTDERYRELLVEVKRSQAIAKPVVARRIDGKREIVDGEHNWRAAVDAGLQHIPCIMLEIDDFESMRQCYKRNQGGEHDPLREALMFHDMMKSRGLSQRGLAEEINVDEATLRNRLKYLKALALRKGSAVDDLQVGRDDYDADCRVIGELTLDQVKAYLKLPPEFRDKWVDHGAKMNMLRQPFFFADRQAVAGDSLIERIAAAGLVDLVNIDHWVTSLPALGKFALWSGDHILLQNVESYVRPAAKFGFPMGATGGARP